jgi:hypothetical protein
MEILGEPFAQWCLVLFYVVEEILTGLFEVGEFFVIFMRERFLFEKFPESFNQVEMGRIRRSKDQFYFSKFLTRLFHFLTVIITRVVS